MDDDADDGEEEKDVFVVVDADDRDADEIGDNGVVDRYMST